MPSNIYLIAEVVIELKTKIKNKKKRKERKIHWQCLNLLSIMRTECHFSKSYQIEKERETDGQNTIINEHHGSV